MPWAPEMVKARMVSRWAGSVKSTSGGATTTTAGSPPSGMRAWVAVW